MSKDVPYITTTDWEEICVNGRPSKKIFEKYIGRLKAENEKLRLIESKVKTAIILAKENVITYRKVISEKQGLDSVMACYERDVLKRVALVLEEALQSSEGEK